MGNRSHESENEKKNLQQPFQMRRFVQREICNLNGPMHKL